jgi:glutamate-ammonia-ligase adenylyltransferase
MNPPVKKHTAAKQTKRKSGRAPKAEALAAQAGATLAARVISVPCLTDAQAARARVAEWLAGLSPGEGKPLNALLAAHPLIVTLLESLSESSPFLWELVSRDPERLLRLLNTEPDAHFAAILAERGHAAATTEDDAEAMRQLRRMKAEAALLIALADIGGVWPVMRAAHALTELADAAVDAATRFALAEAARAGRLTPKNKAEPQAGSGYIVIAMGKMGAFELNYSSDIDLIVFYDPAAQAVPDMAPAPVFVKVTQRLVKLLQERTGDGYVFRTDLRLRPDPASTAIAISTPAAVSYYESVGQNWERAAMIKARACAGDIEAGEAILSELSPFVWRKYLDYAAVADVHAMKRQINAYRGHGEIAVEGHNIKLGRGGIREVEFFAQTQQLIAGGRNPHLRDRDTLTTLDKLAEDRWIDESTRDDMKAAYCFLRQVEHRLQMVNDEQTQVLPADRDGVERFARFLGYANRDAFANVLVGHLDKVQRHYARLFEKMPAGPDRPPLNFPADADDHRTLDRLSELGYRKPLEVSTIVRQWLSGGCRSLQGETARGHLGELLPALLEQLARTDNPDSAVVAFDHFLANLHAAARLFSLLRQNPDLISLIALVLGIAPRLADTLARYPQVMDALVDPSFFGALPDDGELGRRLDAALAQSLHDEDLLERIRMFGLEYMFLIGVRILTGTVTARQAGEAFARLADAVIRAVHRAVGENFAAAHGRIASQENAVLAMGKLGGYEMTASSDLDLILIYDFDAAHPESDGARPLYGAQYFARLTQRLINALTAQTNYGALYQVDMRLRPSGRAGPLATQIEGFAGYQENEAWTWEHMALTRARVVSASPAFRARVEAVIGDVLRRPRDAALIAGDVVEMRGAIAKEKGDRDRWDLKYAAGGLVDIEFIAQYLQLVHGHDLPEILDTSTARVLDKAWSLRVLAVEDAEALRSAVQLYQDVTQILRLCLPGPFDPKTAGAGLLRLLARAADVPDFAALDATLTETQTRVRESFVRILGKSP